MEAPGRSRRPSTPPGIQTRDGPRTAGGDPGPARPPSPRAAQGGRGGSPGGPRPCTAPSGAVPSRPSRESRPPPSRPPPNCANPEAVVPTALRAPGPAPLQAAPGAAPARIGDTELEALLTQWLQFKVWSAVARRLASIMRRRAPPSPLPAGRRSLCRSRRASIKRRRAPSPDRSRPALAAGPRGGMRLPPLLESGCRPCWKAVAAPAGKRLQPLPATSRRRRLKAAAAPCWQQTLWYI